MKRYVTVNHKRFLTFLISTFNFFKQSFAEKWALCPDFLQLSYPGADIFIIKVDQFGWDRSNRNKKTPNNYFDFFNPSQIHELTAGKLLKCQTLKVNFLKKTEYFFLK